MPRFTEELMDTWTPSIWAIILDRLQNGNVKGGLLAWPIDLEKKTPAQRTQWASNLPLVQLPQTLLEIIYGRLVGFSEEVRYMEEAKIHAIHGLLKPHGVLKHSVEKWLKRPETMGKMKSMIRSYKDCDEALEHLEDCISFPRESTGHPYNVNPAYDAAVHCSECLKFLVDWKIVSLTGYDLSGRNWIEAGLNGPNMDLLTYMVNNLSCADLTRPRDIRDSHEDHILLSLGGVGAFAQFLTVLKRLREANLASFARLRTIFNDAVMHEFCAIAPVEVAEALYQSGINIGNVESQHHEAGGRLESSWHIAAAFNPAGASFMEFLEKFSVLNPRIRNSENMTPLMYAACFDEPASIKWLCSRSDPSLPRLEGGPRGYALICAGRSSYIHSGEIFATILSYLPDELFTPEYGRIFGTEIAEGLASHKRRLAEERIDEPSQGVMEVLAVRKMQALVRRLPADWPESEWCLALDAFLRSNDMSILLHSIGTESRKAGGTAGGSAHDMYPPSPTLGQKLAEQNENEEPIDMFNFDPLLGTTQNNDMTAEMRAADIRRNRPHHLTVRSGGRQTGLGPVRDPNNMITKAARKRASVRWI
ncbi:hypothetical protein N7457_006585 [Penicillium paradoxum]|uniref:uncharacterized protein n=1 Tax=Penicillium paradoxum TaxID=176176 RepID=UPI0025481852|nr:uncharacterized protein N7457_006585 [Penicillium paradoxum]KAJ5778865.1 hypothetical protein N7457_006585 [Penicillium paradoxum]